jgi:hypothetical protein
MRRKAYDDTMQGYYNDAPSDYPTGQPDQYNNAGTGGYYQQNPTNPPQQSYNVGGVV